MAFLKWLFGGDKKELEIINFEKLFMHMGICVKEHGEKRQVIYQADYMNNSEYKRHKTRFNGKLIGLTDFGYIERFRVPYTFDKADIEGLKDKLELQTNKSLDIEFIQSLNGAYFDIKVYSHKLKEKYNFELIEPKEKDKLLVSLGYGRLGLVDFKIDKHIGLFGESGSGKSTILKNILTQLVLNYNSDELELYLSDNKGGTELNIYADLVHTKAFTKDLNGLKAIFKELNEEAEKRYKVLFDVKLEDIKSYNKKFKKNKLSNILFVIEEFVAVYKDKTIQSMLQTALSQWRSVGIYILITTQRPSSKVITGDLKCNLGIILGLKTLDSNNSNVVIDKYNLLNNLRGNGHGYIRYNGKLEEFQSFYIDHTEVKKRIRNIERKKEKIEEAPKTDAKVVVLKKEGLKEETTNNNSIGEVESLDFLDSL
jgi:S-DNA-T family DNA segregation ATPase FtsK/SpoIIIE